jgi:hypothetical protein
MVYIHEAALRAQEAPCLRSDGTVFSATPRSGSRSCIGAPAINAISMWRQASAALSALHPGCVLPGSHLAVLVASVLQQLHRPGVELAPL